MILYNYDIYYSIRIVIRASTDMIDSHCTDMIDSHCTDIIDSHRTDIIELLSHTDYIKLCFSDNNFYFIFCKYLLKCES